MSRDVQRLHTGKTRHQGVIGMALEGAGNEDAVPAFGEVQPQSQY